MIFDLTAIRNMYSTHYPTSASLALTRTSSGYYSTAINLYLYAGNQSGIPAVNVSESTDAPRPTKVTSAYAYSISANQGAKSVGISTALIDSIGNGSSNCLFMDAGKSREKYMGFTGRGDLTKIVLTIEWATRTTAASAPTACSVNQTVAENNVTLSWSGASGGVSNGITSYEIQYSDSTNNSTWGDWTDLSTVTTTATSGSLSAAPPSVRGNYRRFRVRTRGAAGSAYYSGWKISTNSVRKNNWPIMPTTAAASPAVYSDETITLTWSGASGITSAIKGYMIASRTSTDNAAWDSWTALATINLAATSGSYNPTVSRTPGIYTQFGVWTIDVLDSYSSEKISNSVLCVQRDVPPPEPLVAAPRNGGVTYNSQPLFLIQTQPEPDGQPQTVYVQTPSGEWHNSVDNADHFTASGALGGGIRTIYVADALAPGTYSVVIRTWDGTFYSRDVARSFTILPSPFEDIVSNETHVKARHISDLRTAVNNFRYYYGMTAYVWATEIAPGRTQVAYWPIHILELRSALQDVVDLVNSYADGMILADWLDIGAGRPRADVMNQLVNLVLEL
jgi:hypothetical protein